MSESKDPTLEFEHSCFAAGAELVIGIDEVGRGAIAGPVAVGVHAVDPSVEAFPVGLRDSKLLSEKKRETLAPLVSEWGHGAIGYVSAAEIDERGITWALGEAGRRGLLLLHEMGLPVTKAMILVDGKHDWLSPALRSPLNVQTMIGGDRACASVAAASVGAKVDRDAVMRAAHDLEPHYAWASNKGYGAKAHYEGIASHGLSELHRKSWIK
ncbi:ribonuclease HII [Leucobacter sp. UT-8R-CII-1-4]|uniref:ribonuclease HII n=1 Tax=Leucobacter sp. UT-8R-CII-1-4 TaxID=3040075 RepID=UPI0024A8FC98|nr:ribonuclease HII [Leucobacter sp. UT-8R-CII-1-4]MDI6023029.1 ribonuclease HII [Leucobacter sp. UT-8R-CII-1-4]